ncbi:hypothetical protein C8N32_13114 [Rhodovulum imhoffii]|uniref:SnoaL-like domain-containing protein n=1 Tax=Rhodovulum imhoffii TaxID=365340 RepID=A0A2T5BNL1_9RHOB|nr:hypothetical protein [Rhodovulum imhoffii]MBK5934608.1 hypothetical protein [Rhodovulum imhoffii]PTN00563.1 hypothetical protein C8N32_13114 [Rhodovulum imhoffii]
MTKVDTLIRWLHDVVGNGYLDRIADLCDTDTHVIGLMPGTIADAADMRVFIDALLHLVRNPTHRVLQAMENGAWVSVVLEIRAFSIGGARPITLTGQMTARFEADKLAEVYTHFDMIGFFEMLGLLPSDAMALGISGQKIA